MAMHIYSTKIWQASTQGLIIVILVFLFPAISHSDTSQLEIEHLYTTILNSNCDWMRNNKHYTPTEAVKHIRKKADFHKKEIKTAEDFIRLAATKSTFSGRYYEVSCPNERITKAQSWLLNQLKEFRGK